MLCALPGPWGSRLSAAGGEPRPVYLGLGSNIAPKTNLPRAIRLLQETVTLIAHSTAWQNPAVGSDGPDFVNAAALILTDQMPQTLKEKLLRPLEARLGRVRTAHKNAPRPIDLDILIDDGALVDANIWKYAHLAVPLAELYPDYTQSTTGLRLADIAKQLAHPTRMYPRPDILQKTLRVRLNP